MDVKIAKNALCLMETAPVAHPYILSDIVATVPYKRNCCVYLLSAESPIPELYGLCILCSFTELKQFVC